MDKKEVVGEAVFPQTRPAHDLAEGAGVSGAIANKRLFDEAPSPSTDPPMTSDTETGAGEVAGRLRCLQGIAQDAPGGWTRLNPEARALIRQSAAEVDRLTKIAEAGMGVIASLAAAISLLERTPRAKKAAASDRMFDLMLDDYRRALERARATALQSARSSHGL